MAHPRAVVDSPVTASGARSDYRAHLDGIRALAVLPVIAFHSGISSLSGGFIGVDVFFVLSGYLVTGVLITELSSSGGLRLRRFYARRVRRLLPMAILVLVVTLIVFALTASPLFVSDAIGSFRASFLYYANWYFIGESTEYLGSDIEASPILHYWSLAIEEQFYLAWPLLVLGMSVVFRRLGARWLRGAALITACGVAASLFLAHTLGSGDVDRAYFGTDTRAYQLLLGATLAMLPALPSHVRLRSVCHALGAAALTGLALLATSTIEMSPIGRGTAAAVCAALLVLVVESPNAPTLGSLLARRPLVWIGLLSYSVYLWHLPVIYVLEQVVGLDNPLLVFALTTPIALGLAQLSALLLETRIRRAPRLDARPILVVGVGLSCSLVGALLVAPTAREAWAYTSASEIDWEAARKDFAPITQCQDSEPEDCIVVEGDGLHIALVGDSHVRVWQSTFEAIARERGYTLSVFWRGGCGWQRGVTIANSEKITENCYAAQDDWYDRVIPALDPDVVVLTHRATFDRALPFFANFDAFAAASDETAKALSADDRTLVILEPLPITSVADDPLACLADGGSPNSCSFEATPSPTPLEEVYRSLDAAGLVTSVDADAVMCPRLPRCDAVDGELIVFRDNNHMTATYARSKAADLDALLVAAGVLPG